LTVSTFVGVGLLFFSAFLKPIPGFEFLVWHRAYSVAVGALVLVCVGLGLRSARKTTKSNSDWLTLRELFFLIGLALLVTAIDIQF